jgi:hypothetical protein
MCSRHTYIFVLACSAWACGSTDGGHPVQTAGKAGISGSAAGGGAALAGAGGAGSGSAGTGAAGRAVGGASAGSTGSAGAAGNTSQRCLQPQDRSGNWTECSNRLLHRSTPGRCDSNLPRAQVLPPQAATDECQQDSECTAHPHGFCEATFLPPFDYSNKCNYGCVSDSECKADEVCVCVPFRPFADGPGDPSDVVGPNTFGAIVGSCQRSADGCHSDADCSSGAWCANFVSHCTGTGVAFACQTPNDECASDFDCAGPGDFCGYENGARVCQSITCQF